MGCNVGVHKLSGMEIMIVNQLGGRYKMQPNLTHLEPLIGIGYT